jgi:hypothetical protein
MCTLSKLTQLLLCSSLPFYVHASSILFLTEFLFLSLPGYVYVNVKTSPREKKSRWQQRERRKYSQGITYMNSSFTYRRNDDITGGFFHQIIIVFVLSLYATKCFRLMSISHIKTNNDRMTQLQDRKEIIGCSFGSFSWSMNVNVCFYYPFQNRRRVAIF